VRKLILWAAALAALAIVGEQWMCGPGAGPGSRVSGPAAALIGKPAPEFELPQLGGGMVGLPQHRGKVVVLDFWASWCGPCRRSMPALDNLQQRFSSDLVLLAINMEESEDTVRAYVDGQEFRSRVLLDLEGITSRSYSVRSIPMQVIVDPEGIVQDVQIGFAPDIESRIADRIGKLRKPAAS
jgi:thiol-disulfide isomerase/thioredoxin